MEILIAVLYLYNCNNMENASGHTILSHLLAEPEELCLKCEPSLIFFSGLLTESLKSDARGYAAFSSKSTY